MRPIGRHHTSGLSLLLSAIRLFLRSAAHGCSGSWKPRPATSPNVDSGIPSAVVVGGGGAPCRPRPPPPPPARIQMPEKSTLPSAVRGVGASRVGLPSAARGTPGVGCDGHCANNFGDIATTTATTPASPILLAITRNLLLVRPPSRSSLRRAGHYIYRSPSKTVYLPLAPGACWNLARSFLRSTSSPRR